MMGCDSCICREHDFGISIGRIAAHFHFIPRQCVHAMRPCVKGEPTIEIFVSLGALAIYARHDVARAIHQDCSGPGGIVGDAAGHVTYVDEGLDVLAARKEVRSRDRAQRTTSKKARDKIQQSHVGEALRSIYQETVNEEIPGEFLDILGKLA